MTWLDPTDLTTALREAEAREAELRLALDQARRVAHDLNNILGPAVALPDLMEIELEEILAGRGTAAHHRSLRRALQLMGASSQRAVDAVQELLLLGRQGRQGRQAPEAPAYELPTGAERVLVVDDEEGQRDVATRILARLGYTAVAVEDGEGALARFRAAHRLGSPPPFDIVLMDMQLGPGMDGVATLEAIQALYPAQRALVVSGYAPAERGQVLLERGARWLIKPYDVPQLARALRACLDC